MKQKLFILIITLILVSTLGACNKENIILETESDEIIATEETLNEVNISTQEKTNIETALVPTVAPTTAPTQALEVNITPMKEADEFVGNITTIIMPTPPFHYYLSDAASEKENQALKLNVKSSRPNEIIDEEDWFINNNLTLNTFQVPNSYDNTSENLPDGIDNVWNDLIITAAFYDDAYIYCSYGSDFSEGYLLNIYDIDTLKSVYTFDFSNYRFSPEYVENDYIQHKVNWAEIKDDILYISHSHNTYAVSSNYLNAYITAIKLDDMSILWRSDALVSNSYNFLIYDNIIFCGYGFTAEPDFLYQLDINSGEVLEKTSLKSAPSYLIEKNNVLYVRTYNTDYEFEINQ